MVEKTFYVILAYYYDFFYLALLLWNDRRNGKVVYNKTLSYTYFCNLLLVYYLDRCLKETETIGRYIEKI